MCIHVNVAAVYVSVVFSRLGTQLSINCWYSSFHNYKGYYFSIKFVCVCVCKVHPHNVHNNIIVTIYFETGCHLSLYKQLDGHNGDVQSDSCLRAECHAASERVLHEPGQESA